MLEVNRKSHPYFIKYPVKYILLSFLFLISTHSYSQSTHWPGIPLLDESGVVLLNQTTFIGVISTAAVSYGLAQFVFKDNKPLHFHQARVGVFGTYGGTIIMENYGIEKRLAPWFGLGLEINNQQWIYEDGNGAGMGLNTYYRWHLLGKKKLSPYLEYGAGFFYGFSEFPPNGTNFTFNLTTQLGAEYTLDTKDKIRLSYGNIHQSNNGLLDPNPDEDGNGFNFTYLMALK
jgi:hypothetical protein